MSPLFSQGFSYLYDFDGTRLTRGIYVQPQQSHALVDSIINPKKLKSANVVGSGQESQVNIPSEFSDTSSSIKGSEDGKITTLIYPNPNKGLLNIEISNMPSNSVNEMRLYDLSGMEIASKRNFDSKSEIDISQFKDGIYILRIKINDKVFDWKVIKNRY